MTIDEALKQCSESGSKHAAIVIGGGYTMRGTIEDDGDFFVYTEHLRFGRHLSHVVIPDLIYAIELDGQTIFTKDQSR